MTEAAVAVVAPLMAAVAVLWWFRRRRRDEIFTRMTPGELPGLGHDAQTGRVRTGEWSGPIAPRFTEPDDPPAGLAGTVIDGVADVRDLTATLVDLAARQVVDITQEGDDWLISRSSIIDDTVGERSGADLAAHERAVLVAFLGDGTSVRLSELRRSDFAQALRVAQLEFYREVVARGLYRRHPRSRNNLLAALGLVVLAAAAVGGVVAALRWRTGTEALWIPTLAVGVALAGVAFMRLGRGRTPRTARGTAMRIQALGFREYLATAEAGQLRWEEAQQLFPRFLPYAVAFGVAEHWSSTVGAVARAANLRDAGEGALSLALDAVTDPSTMGNLLDLVPDGVDLSALTDVDIDLGSGDVGFLDLDLGDVFSAIGDGVSSLADGVGNLVDVDWLDGCGCLFDW